MAPLHRTSTRSIDECSNVRRCPPPVNAPVRNRPPFGPLPYTQPKMTLRTRIVVALVLAALVPVAVVLAVSLVRLAPYAVLDVFTLATLAATVVVLMLWRVNTIKVMLGGAVLGIARSRLLSLPVTRSLLSAVTRS